MTDENPENVPRIIICGDPGPHEGCVHDPNANWEHVPVTLGDLLAPGKWDEFVKWHEEAP